ncbi:MAG: tRNA lysidine(34) synthetase TilS [Gammaproteobacteria bacterium]|nr:tRNA lysidine(34) synthetase TilS [Gammaproteobacteria bacterium]
MSFSSAVLAKHLINLESIASKPARYIIAFSGGLDSMVLLHALKNHVFEHKNKIPIFAVHINHGLQAESLNWVNKCEKMATSLGILFKSINIQINLNSGNGLEAAARDARYSALDLELGNGDWLITAHHREDQAETLLLNLIRGSGPTGIAGISQIRRFGKGWLARPIINIKKNDLVLYAKENALDWIEDPSNMDQHFDRNFLRHQILTRLELRWPNISGRLERSSLLAGEASQLLSELAEIDFRELGADATKIPINKLLNLSIARQRNVIRYALRNEGLSMPSRMQLNQILNEAVFARKDAQPLVRWKGVIIRRYRNFLYLMPEKQIIDLKPLIVSNNELLLGPGMGQLNFEKSDKIGLSKELFEKGLVVRFRSGGEKIYLYNQSYKRKLKKLLQEKGIVPWMRNQLPLVYSGENLVAVGDLWLAKDATSCPGIKVRWIDRPALH